MMNMNNWEPRGTWQKLLDVFQPYAVEERQRQFIENLEFPTGVRERFAHARSLLSSTQLKEAEDALRDYFQICREANGQMISMPSQVADDLWHEFVLHTRLYATFCDQAFGRFFHHSPAGTAQATPTALRTGILRAWIRACEREEIDPYKPTRLPRLFALDAKLGATDGFTYDKDALAAEAIAARRRQQIQNGTPPTSSFGSGYAAGSSGSDGSYSAGSSDGDGGSTNSGHHSHHSSHHSSHDSHSAHSSHGHSDSGHSGHSDSGSHSDSGHSGCGGHSGCSGDSGGSSCGGSSCGGSSCGGGGCGGGGD